MTSTDLRGMGVALVTPFNADNSIDYVSLENLLEYQIANGTDYLVVLGTTAETPTLTPDERKNIKEFVAEKVAGRIPLILGLGGNSTAAVLNEIKQTDFNGYSAILSVVPFYNKPSQEGIYNHYKAIAGVSPLPIILYNVPGRTGCNMEAATVLRLAHDFKNIIAVKEASGNVKQIEDILIGKPEGFAVISGDDAFTHPLLCLGAIGVISVIGNLYPAEFGHMVRTCLKGKHDEALPVHYGFMELFKLLSIEGNPAGIKCAMGIKGAVKNLLRLPLVPVSKDTEQKIAAVLNHC